TTDEESTGTTAEVYLPPSVLVEGRVDGHAQGQAAGRATGPRARIRVAPPPKPVPDPPVDSLDGVPAGHRDGPVGSGPPATLLPRRTPGSSGITDVPDQHADQRSRRRELATPWWEDGAQQEPRTESQQAESQQVPAGQAPSDTSAFFAARS